MNHLKRRFHLLVHSALQHAASREMLEGILRFAAVHPEWEIQIEGGHPSGRSIEVYPEWKPDALITNERSLKYSRKDFCKIAGRAVVYVNTRPRRDVGIPYATISSEDRVLAESAAAFFLRKQMASFAFVGSPGGERWSEARRRLFQAALREKSYPLHTFNPPQSRSWEKQEKALVAWLAKLPKPCGVFAVHDPIGEEVLAIAASAGIAVPEELAVVGVDDHPVICERTKPTLSSIRLDFEQGGYLCAELLDRRMHDRRFVQAAFKFGPVFVTRRQSTRRFRLTDSRVSKAAEFIRRNACDGIHVADVVNVMGVSRRMAETLFCRHLGRTIHDEIIGVRMERVEQLLRRPGHGISAIAGLCGWASESVLRKSFKESHGGLSMREWRVQAHQ